MLWTVHLVYATPYSFSSTSRADLASIMTMPLFLLLTVSVFISYLALYSWAYLLQRTMFMIAVGSPEANMKRSRISAIVATHYRLSACCWAF
jgi:uncharacterized membrane protein